MATITIKTAIKAGYIHAGKQDQRWQSLHKLEDLTDEDIEMEEGSLFLATKEFTTPGINEESLREMVSESIADDWSNDTADDSDDVYDKVNEVDFKILSDTINEKLKDVKAYKITNIQLVKD